MNGKRKKKQVVNEEKDELVNDAENCNSSEETSTDEVEKNENGNTVTNAELTPDQLLEVQKSKYAELNDRFLRLYAEFDNFRKRTQRERIELIQSASAEMMLQLLPVVDDFDRAVKAVEQSNDLEALKEGMILVNQKFKGILVQKGLEEMKSIGEAFNTDLHEAMANVQATDKKDKGKVVDEVEKGYYLNGKVLRYAKVVVAG
jgi:molecular chaperone GrpE